MENWKKILKPASALISDFASKLVTTLALILFAGVSVRRPRLMNPRQVSEMIGARLDDRLSEREWEIFLNMPIQDPDMDEIRIQAAKLGSTLDDLGREKLAFLREKAMNMTSCPNNKE